MNYDGIQNLHILTSCKLDYNSDKEVVFHINGNRPFKMTTDFKTVGGLYQQVALHRYMCI